MTARLSHLDHVKWAEFSPDGTRIVTASTDNTACIWDAHTGQAVAPPLQHARIVEKAVFSPDGGSVATASLDRTARVWDARTGQALTPPLQHDSPVGQVRFSPDGRRILTASWSGATRLWDSKTGLPLTEWLDAGHVVFSACFNPTGERIATGSLGWSARVWELPPVPTPVPAWFPPFAEAVAGTRLSARGNVELVSRLELEEFIQHLAREKTNAYYERLARWFLADPAQRPVAPF